MNLICISCMNPIVPDDCVYITNCGHIFHRHCLFNWLEGTNACPECYLTCTTAQIRRLYLNFASESSEQETDNERARRSLAEQDALLSDLEEKIIKLLVDRENLETEIVNLKAKYSQEKEQEIKDLKAQIQQSKSVQKKLMEAISWESIHKVLTGSVKDVEEELTNVKSQRQLARMIVLLRRDIRTAEDERKALRAVLRESQEENVKLNSENRELSAKKLEILTSGTIH